MTTVVTGALLLALASCSSAPVTARASATPHPDGRMASPAGSSSGSPAPAGSGAGPSATTRSHTAPVPATSRTPVQDTLKYRYLTDSSEGTGGQNLGYNLVDTGPYPQIINGLPAGERALVWIGDYSLSSCTFSLSDAAVSRALAPLAGDPKVAGYYLADEADDALPAFGGHCPDVANQVRARSRLVHSLAPGAFTYEVVTEPANFAAFATVTDVMGADPYPCRQGRSCDWSMIPRYIAALTAAHVARYWGVLQVFSSAPWRYPTPAELLAMIRQWQRSGWQGEQSFAWRYDGRTLAGHPRLLAILRALNQGRIRPGMSLSALEGR